MTWADLLAGVFIGFSMHHYWVDQFIWRPGKSEQLRKELKLTEAAPTSA